MPRLPVESCNFAKELDIIYPMRTVRTRGHLDLPTPRNVSEAGTRSNDHLPMTKCPVFTPSTPRLTELEMREGVDAMMDQLLHVRRLPDRRSTAWNKSL